MILFDRLRTALDDRYLVERELGRGGMATVYLAHDRKHHREVAIKVLRPEIGAALGPERFLREIRTAASLHHPHILGLIDSGEVPAETPTEPALLYYVMPYVEGESLRDRLKRERQLPIDETVGIARQVADALGYAHSHGIVHRDIKPENILLSAGGHVLVADFGIAKAVTDSAGEKLTETGLALGTPFYMSPEQASGDMVDGRADQYALGCVVYEMLAGNPPFQGPTSQAILARHAVDPVPSLRTVRGSVTGAIEAAIGRTLAKVPADRFISAPAFADALTQVLTVPPTSQTRTGRRVAVGVVAGAALAVLAIVLNARGGAGPAPITSLAVAPLENLTGDSAQVYLAQGMTDQLISDLSQISALKVIRLDQMPNQDSILALARQLKLGGVLGGSLQRSGSALHITLRLVAPGTGQALWGRSEDGDLDDVFGLQKRVARSVTDWIRVSTTSQERSRLEPVRQPVRPPAYEAYVRGSYFLRRVTEADLHKAITYFQQAVGLEPTYAAAYAGMSDAYNELGYFDIVAPAEAFPKARQAALRALDLDSTLAEAHIGLGRASFFYDWKFDVAEQEFRRAIELNPRLAWAHLILSMLLTSQGRKEEALAEALKAQELDPLSLLISAATARVYYNAGRYDDALTQARKTLEIDSTFSRAHFWLGMAYTQKRMYADAIRELELTLQQAPIPLYQAALGHAYAVSGQREKALKILHDLQERSKLQYISPFGLASIYAGLGDRERTMAMLQEAYQVRASYLAFLEVDPQFALMRQDPRYIELLRKIDNGETPALTP